MKKSILTLIVLLVTNLTFSQEIKAPKMSGISGVDALARKAITTHTESKAIASALSLLKINSDDAGNVSIKGNDGKDLDPQKALDQLNTLSKRVKSQTSNLSDLLKLKETASKALKGAKFMKKAKGAKTMKRSLNLEKLLISQTKEQGQVLLQQIGIVQALLSKE